MLDQERGHGVHNTRTIGTGESEDKVSHSDVESRAPVLNWVSDDNALDYGRIPASLRADREIL